MSQTNQNGIKNLDEYKNLVNQKTSALSNLGQANKVAMKYADNTALAQGYATQGAMLQNNANLQNAYMNQVGGVNQQFQQQLGNLKNTASSNELNAASNRLLTAYENGSLNQEKANAILEESKNSGLLQDNDYRQLKNYADDTLMKAYGDQQTASITSEQADLYGIDTASDSGVSLEKINTYKYGTSSSSVFGKKYGSIADMTGLQHLIKTNKLKDGDTVKMGKNVIVYINGKFYKADKNINPTYIAYDYRQWQN